MLQPATCCGNHRTGYGSNRRFVVANNRVYFTASSKYDQQLQHELHALDAWTGESIWRYSSRSRHWPPSLPTVVDDTAYVIESDSQSLYVSALDTTSGERLWDHRAIDWESGELTQPTVVDGVVYVGSNKGEMFALRASNGEFLWKYDTGHTGISSPGRWSHRRYCLLRILPTSENPLCSRRFQRQPALALCLGTGPRIEHQDLVPGTGRRRRSTP